MKLLRASPRDQLQDKITQHFLADITNNPTNHKPHNNTPKSKHKSKTAKHNTNSTENSQKTPANNIPSFSATTFNTNSLSANPTKTKSPKARRHANIVHAIRLLLKASDFLALQETHLGANDHHALSAKFPKHVLLYNNYKLGERGTLLIFPKRILQDYTYQVSSKVAGPHTKGRIQAIQFTPRHSTGGHHPFLVINVYLQSDQNVEALSSQLRAIARIPTCPYTYLLGDFNFTENQEDSPSEHSNRLISGSPLELWNQVLEIHNLHEVRQPAHSHYQITKIIKNSHSSRIDRIYISHSPADLTVTTPTAFLPHLPINILNSYQSALAGMPPQTHKKPLFSDHLPVSVHFTDSTPSKKRAQNVPRWLADTEGFGDAIMERFGVYQEHNCPFQSLDRWKRAVRQTSTAYFRTQREQRKKYNSTAGELSAAIRLLRMVSKNAPDAPALARYLELHDQLADLIPEPAARPIDASRLREHIHVLLTDELDTKDKQEQEKVLHPTLPDSSKPTQDTKQRNLVDDLKSRLPINRKRLAMLRDPSTKQPVTNPRKMARIIKKSWGKLWARSGTVPSYSRILRYLRKYPTRIPTNLAPAIPSYDVILEHIHGTNNSSSGPDGIPFAMYRLCAGAIAPVLLGIINALASGVTPPAGYNYARLFLIPKDDSFQVEAHRPISVTNADNRIIAKALTYVITPALQAILHPSQRGFVAEREGAQHISDLNQAYYAAQSKRRQHYILFLDTKKAFDSIHHDFVLAVLDAIGMPTWFCTAVAGLLSQVLVFPVLGEETGISIEICRGVKQGCPLSPLLFVICYDVLLYFLEQQQLGPNGLDQFAFADDLALSSASLNIIVLSLKVIDTFAKNSGLGLNIDKTVILTAVPPLDSDAGLLRAEGYDTIKLVREATYLGVLMGIDITTVDIFRKAKAKCLARLHSYRAVIYSVALHKRILIINIFLLPILYYLAQFFVIPYHEVVIPIKLAVHRAVVPFNGGGLGYAHLISPRGEVGPHTPLRDLWATNFSLLILKYPTLTSSHGAPIPVMGPHTKVHTPKWGSLLITEHRAHAAFVYMELYCVRDSNHMIDVQRLGPNPAGARRKVYYDLVDRGYLLERTSSRKRFKSSLPNKLRRTLRLPDQADAEKAARHLRAHATIASPSIGPKVRNDYLRLIHNALPTDVRRASARMEVPIRNRGEGSPYPCYLCGKGEDSYVHLLSDCQVVRGALANISSDVGITIAHDLQTLTLNFPPTSTNLPTNVILHFASSLWTQRQYYTTLAEPPPIDTAIRRLTDYTLDRLAPTGPKQNISTTQEIATLAIDPPEDAFVCFTDGSAIPNPGPAGSGIHGTAPALHLGGSPLIFHLASALGNGDNNLGEMHAIYSALRIAEERLSGCDLAPPTILIFSDSLLCICFLLHGWSMKRKAPIAIHTRTLLRRLSKRFTIRLYWVRGHAKVPRNEIADGHAKAGARHNKKGRFSAERPGSRFLPGTTLSTAEQRKLLTLLRSTPPP